MKQQEADYLIHELNYHSNCIACESHKAVLSKRIKELIDATDIGLEEEGE